VVKTAKRSRATPELDPASFPVGTVVGPWRVERWGGRGTYGAVYRATRVGHDETGTVALKVALHPEDPRFEREVKLLSRLRHPNVPRYLGHGTWRHGPGAMHPYVAMEWIQGRPLYDWSALRNPNSRQVLRVLAQVARALQAVHELQAVHRDVKGANLLVRPGDGRVFLLDLGLASYTGARELTPQPFPPGTLTYRSPEAWRFVKRFGNTPTARYVARPADDLFALGVTAYRLVTDEYPASARLGPDAGAPAPPAELNSRVAPRLNALILQLLSEQPEARGTAKELAGTLEEAAEQLGPEGDLPLFAWESLSPASWSAEDVLIAVETRQRPRQRDMEVTRLTAQWDAAEKEEQERQEREALARANARTERDPARNPFLRWRFRLISLAAGVLVLVGGWWAGLRGFGHVTWVGKNGGFVALGDEARSQSKVASPATSSPNGMQAGLPNKLFKGQLRPPCPRGYLEVRGGCWARLQDQPPNCPQHAYEWQGGCYVPLVTLEAPATSNPP
jgi:hypothetical protein